MKLVEMSIFSVKLVEMPKLMMRIVEMTKLNMKLVEMSLFPLKLVNLIIFMVNIVEMSKLPIQLVEMSIFPIKISGDDKTPGIISTIPFNDLTTEFILYILEKEFPPKIMFTNNTKILRGGYLISENEKVRKNKVPSLFFQIQLAKNSSEISLVLCIFAFVFNFH